MERMPYNPEDEDTKPEKTGESDASKKKRKKTRVPLKKTVKKETRGWLDGKSEEDSGKAQPDKEKAKKEDGKQPETDKADKKAESADQPLELPEVEEQPDQAEQEDYEGELVIDHSDETAEKPAMSEMLSEQEVDTIEPMISAQETEQPADAAENAAETPAEPAAEEEQEPQAAPPSVAPPLPFVLSTGSMPGPETEAGPAENDNNASRYRGRLSEEWAALRRRETEATQQPTITEEEANERTLRAKKRGLSSGVVSGGLVGYLIGRRGKRSVERSSETDLKSRDETIKRLTRERDSALNEAQQRQSVIKRTQTELQELMRRSWDNRILKRYENEPRVETTRAVERPATERPRAVFETPPVHEKVNAAAQETAQTLPLPEEAPEYRAIKEETYQAPEGRRVEASTWHRIEVDEKTGQAVENPAVAYGEAFKREQQQEKLARQAAQAQTAAQVGMALLYGGTQPTDTPMVPPDYAYTQQAPARQASVRAETAHAVRQIARNTGNPFTWAAALVIVVLLFLAGVVR